MIEHRMAIMAESKASIRKEYSYERISKAHWCNHYRDIYHHRWSSCFKCVNRGWIVNWKPNCASYKRFVTSKTEREFVMFKKFGAFLIAIALIVAIVPSSFAASEDTKYAILDGHGISYLQSSGASSMSPRGGSSDIIVISEEQMLDMGSGVKALFNNAEMVYITTGMSMDEILLSCDMTSNVGSEDTSDSKVATAVRKLDDGTYSCHDVSVMYATQESGISAVSSLQNVLTEDQLILDGLCAVLTTEETSCNAIVESRTRLAPTGSAAYKSDSAVVYDASNNRIGTMGYTLYFYKVVKSGTTRLFDTICISTFAPDNGYKCAKMSVFLGTSQSTHEVLEAANITSNGSTYTHTLNLSASKTGISGGGSTGWSYTVGAQNVTKSFDMTTNDRTWTFKPVSAANKDAWIEEPGIRTASTQANCYTEVVLSCPFVTILNIELKSNTLSGNIYFTYK